MSPEQWSDPAAVGPRSDLYALAVIASGANGSALAMTAW
jgi:hypothetical protein